MHRFFADPDRETGTESFLTKEDARHAVTVLRLKPGQNVEIIRNSTLWSAEVTLADNNNVRVRILNQLPSTEPCLSVTLFQALPKADKMDMIVQKATELGIFRIVPLIMNRCVVKPDPKDFVRRQERWRKIAREAAKQSGRCSVPFVSDPVTIPALLHSDLPAEKNVVPWEKAEHYGPLSFKNDHPVLSSLGILIGPEGGIESEEISSLRSVGFIPVTLGKRILRTETAALSSVASFMCLYGEME